MELLDRLEYLTTEELEELIQELEEAY